MSGIAPSTTIRWPRTKRQNRRWDCAQMRTNQIVPRCETGSAITPPIEEMLLIITNSSQNRIERTRSEEHTSELQSLMRISYAVFCLKKKNIKNHLNKHKNN